MARPTPTLTHARLLAAAVAALVVLSLLPARFAGWVDPPAAVARLVVSPAQQAFRWLGGTLLRPAATPAESALRAIESDRDLWRSRYENLRARADEWRRRLAQYEAGALAPEPSVRTPRAAVIGAAGPPGAHLLRLRAGSADGVTVGTVAVTDNVQVVGRVESVTRGSCTLMLITQPRRDPIDGQIVVDPSAEAPEDRMLGCQLIPRGDGTLRGALEYRPAREGRPPRTAEVGQVVYLADRTWPATSRQFVIGRVTAVQTLPSAPLRPIITVEPTVRLDRLTEVTLRIAADPDAEGGR